MNRGNRLTEVFNPLLELTDPRCRVFQSLTHPTLFNPGLAVIRFFYLLSGSKLMEPISFYTPSVLRFTDDGVTIPGSSYGYRIFDSEHGNQFETAADIIQSRPDTKRAVIQISHPEDTARARDSSDIPCASTLIFMPRGSVLHATVIMRANDAVSLLPYNLFEFSLLVECMAARTAMTLGSFFQSAVSMHVRGSGHHIAPVVAAEQIKCVRMAVLGTFIEELRQALVTTEAVVRRSVLQCPFADSIARLPRLVEGFEPIWADLIAVLLIEALRVRQMAGVEKLLAVCEQVLMDIQQPIVLQQYRAYLRARAVVDGD